MFVVLGGNRNVPTLFRFGMKKYYLTIFSYHGILFVLNDCEGNMKMSNNPFIKAADNAMEIYGDRDLSTRIRTEGKIFKKTVSALIKAGYFVSLNDGEEFVVLDSKKVSEIVEAAFSTDDDILYVREQPSILLEFDAFVRFIYGNDGWDVINDYSTSLELVMKPINDYCDKLSGYEG